MAAALNRFISRSVEKCRPFFDLIKKGKNFHWGDQSDRAFEQLKAYLATAPLLSTPVNEESLYIYLAASEHAVSVAIVREDYNIQKLVYYTSKTLDGEIFATRETGLCIGLLGQKAPTLFPGTHHDCLDRTSVESCIEECRLF